MKKLLLIASVIGCLLNLSGLQAQTLAFPGAEGHGRFTTGGRGGKVVKVTRLDDNAEGEAIIEGSLRWAIEQSSPKTIVFDVSGTIHLKQQLKTKRDNITIAGQSAPGEGICIAGHPFTINSNNVIMRFLRFRPGAESGGEPDGLEGMDKKNIIIDHCSVSWGVDECLSVYGMENLTIQWCLISEALRISNHEKGAHCYGGNWGGTNASYHHNLMAHCESRTPRLGPREGTQEKEYVDIRNNVFYNWAGNGCYGGEGMNVNLINNYYKPGPATDKASSAVKYRIAKIDVRTEEYVERNKAFAPMKHVWGKFYIDGNKVEGNEEVTKDNWTKGVYAQQSNGVNVDNLWTQKTRDTIRLAEPLDFGMITHHTPDAAYEQVLEYVGCCFFRDEIDERIISDTRQRKATYTASGNNPGYINDPADTKPSGASSDWSPWVSLAQGELPLDSDNDGIPDYWEDKMGLDKYKASDANLKNEEGYTNLELYLNSLVEHIIERQNENGELLGGEEEPEEPGLGNEYLSINMPSIYVKENSVYLENISSESQIEIFNLNGICIQRKNISGNTSFDLPNGIYIIRVVSSEYVENFKVNIK